MDGEEGTGAHPGAGVSRDVEQRSLRSAERPGPAGGVAGAAVDDVAGLARLVAGKGKCRLPDCC